MNTDQSDSRRDNALRRALATPPISNEDIVKRSKEKKGGPKPAPSQVKRREGR